MSESNETQNSASVGSGKSEAEIAFELLNKLKGQGVWGERNIEAILNMYAECLDAAKGLRAYPGQSRIDTPVTTRPPAPAAAPQTSVPQATAQPQPAAQPQTTPAASQQPAVQQQPVHAQQNALQQAFKQG